MIEAHTIDSWTLVSERNRQPFAWAIILGGFGAPIFLFLAGIAIPLAAGARLRKNATVGQAAAATRQRGWQIFGLAFLFRLQSWVLGGGALISLLKVDILNVMGLAMVGASTLWGAARRDAWRAAMLLGTVVALAMLTPIVRASSAVSMLPDPVEWYVRPYPGLTTFTLLPWAGFLFAGAALGVWLDRAGTEDAERRLIVALAIAGPAIVLASYATSFLPPIYARTNFWTSSPTFFFLRLGVVTALLPFAYALSRWLPRVSAPLEYFGRASLFVYWIHVEMVYGLASTAIHKRLTFEQALVAYVAFTIFLFALTKARDWGVGKWRGAREDRSPARRASSPASAEPQR